MIKVEYVKRAVPPFARLPCVTSDLPDRALAAGEIVPKWAADRKEIASCDARRAAAVSALDDAP